VKRRVFNVLAAVSLVLCVPIVVLWARSYWRYDQITSGWQDVKSVTGRLSVGIVTNAPKIPQASGWVTFGSDQVDPAILISPAGDVRFQFAGLALFQSDLEPLPALWYTIVIPYWFLTMLTAPLPLWRGAILLRRARLGSAGRCRVCGYDLRATPDRCPECGTAVGPVA
jgi:hypothetical protein